MVTLAARNPAAIPLFVLATLLGALAALAPLIAVGLVASVGITTLAFSHPVVHLTLLVIITAILPFELLNTYSIGGGVGSTGIVIADLFLITGLVRAGLLTYQLRWERFQIAILVAVVGLLAVFVVQFVNGVRSGSVMGTAGNELRVLLGFGTLIIAWPIVRDEKARSRLILGMVIAGLLLGLSGLAQWFFQVSYGASEDFGVREGVRLTSAGRGQLQGGIYGYPVAVILSFGVLLAGRLRSVPAKWLVLAVLIANSVCVLLTFERTIWVVTVFGCTVLALRSGAAGRARFVIVTPLVAVLGLGLLASFAPTTLLTARERLLSIGQYRSDLSVSYRLRESMFVLREIDERPIRGSGLGATIFWGRPAEQVPPSVHSFSHNGFLWMAWKLGVPAALLLFALITYLALRRGRIRGSPLAVTVALGCQSALLSLLIANVTFPSVNALSSTTTVGTLMAFAALPHRRSEEVKRSLSNS